MIDVLDQFLAPTREWFRKRYGEPTPPQALGWPPIQRGEHTLILSPTGSGKTLAAFLWGIDSIFRDLSANPDLSGVQLLYISPLKALNNDIARNLREPLSGIRCTAHDAGTDLPPLSVAVRTGDTPQSARRRMVKGPPHILITTPESLYLILTSPRAREILRSVRAVIVDEIHTLCGNKRGVHLALSLERLGRLTQRRFQRIGLSATQRPLDEVGRFLVGLEWEEDQRGEERLVLRGVTVVDAGSHKELDLRVVTVVPDLRHLPGGSIWPSLIPHVLDEIRRRRTTLIFTNGRRAAERAADRLNEQYAMEEAEEVAPGSPEGLLVDGVSTGKGIFGTGRVGGPFYAHHGSISREMRLRLEGQLKRGELPALIGTSSLELGIDIGSVDAVVQLQSPRGVSRGLQRVGRSGHLVGETSVGRMYATFREDLLDAAAVAHGMLHGDIEPTYTPQNCLDVAAQQIVAMVSVEDWEVESLYRLACQAYGYHLLTRDAFRAVLKMLTGGYPSEVSRELRPRIAWDRVHGTLSALPGSRMLALMNGGTIADRGEFKVYLPDRKTVLGSLDEEFVFETRSGDVFTLGSGTWRVLEIDEDKLVVTSAAGSIPRMPFWNGELPKRDYHMGLQLGAFRRSLAERVADLAPLPDDLSADWPGEAEPVIRWLADEYAMDENSARNAILYVRQQMDSIGTISSDKTVVIELFHDALGDQRMAIHSCFGGRLNSAWALALCHALRNRLHLEVESQVNDDGILFRFLRADRQSPADLVRVMGPDEARERLLLELPRSALFGAQFRMNAARALLLPGVRGRRRTPFWLQRLRAKDLLAATRQLGDFPIIAETYRGCLRDVLDVEHLRDVLAAIQKGDIRVIEAETIVPSPLAAGMLFGFISVYMYEWDTPRVERQMQVLSLNRELLSQLLDEGMLPDLLRPEAIAAVDRELQHLAEGYRARSVQELAVILHEVGDLTTAEVQSRSLGEGRTWLLRLAAEGRAFEIEIPTRNGGVRRWINAEDYARYRDAFGLPDEPPMPIPEELLELRCPPSAAREVLLRVLVRTHGPLTREDILARHDLPDAWLDETLREMVAAGHLVSGRLAPDSQEPQWCDRRVLERIHRRTLSMLRKEIEPVDLPAYADFSLRWQRAHPAHRRKGRDGLVATLQQLRGLEAPVAIWERDVLSARVEGFGPGMLDAVCAEGNMVWVAAGESAAHVRLRFVGRGEGSLLIESGKGVENLGEKANAVRAFLKEEGACYAADVQRGVSLGASEVDQALVELLLAGLVTNDRYEAIRLVLARAWGQPLRSRGMESSLDADLSAWRAKRAPDMIRRPRPERLRRARREVARRMPPPTRWGGRWSLVHRASVLGGEIPEEQRVSRQAHQLLERYGIVTRDCLGREEWANGWARLYRRLQLMEMRGEVRRGYFVRGLPGVQFALPEAVERLRSWATPDADGSDALTVINACDPANPYGPAGTDQGRGRVGIDAGVPGERNPYRHARVPSNYLVVQRGVPILLYEHGGARWKILPGTSDETVQRGVQACLDHLTREGGLCAQPRRLAVRSWNGAPPIGSEAQPLLEGLGFRRESPAMVWDGI